MDRFNNTGKKSMSLTLLLPAALVRMDVDEWLDALADALLMYADLLSDSGLNLKVHPLFRNYL